MRNLILALPLAMSLAACDHKPMHDTVAAKSPQTTAPSNTNTGVNERDRAGTTTTPIDQSNAKADIDHVAEIRKALVEADGISMSGRNVKVMTKAGLVTLRGTVPTAEERARIEEIARKSTATVSVDNQLELETK